VTESAKRTAWWVVGAAVATMLSFGGFAAAEFRSFIQTVKAEAATASSSHHDLEDLKVNFDRHLRDTLECNAVLNDRLSRMEMQQAVMIQWAAGASGRLNVAPPVRTPGSD